MLRRVLFLPLNLALCQAGLDCSPPREATPDHSESTERLPPSLPEQDGSIQQDVSPLQTYGRKSPMGRAENLVFLKVGVAVSSNAVESTRPLRGAMRKESTRLSSVSIRSQPILWSFRGCMNASVGNGLSEDNSLSRGGLVAHWRQKPLGQWVNTRPASRSGV